MNSSNPLPQSAATSPMGNPLPAPHPRSGKPTRAPLNGANARKAAPSERLVGATVAVRLRNGGTITGRYVGGSRYEIELLTDQGRVVVFKHSIDWMMPTSG